MPLYEYACDKCGAIFEVMQKFSDEPVKIHEACGGPVRRLISASAFQFKGSGWYATDYAKNSSSSPDNGSAAKTDSSTGKTEGKTETPATAPASTSNSPESKPSGSDTK